MIQPAIWIGTIEISYSRKSAPNVFRSAFTVVTTWASNADEYREKCARMLESYGWRLLGVERSGPVPDNNEYSEEIEGMLERTRTNPDAIIYGTFHAYPVM